MENKPSSDVISRFTKKGIFPHQFAFTLLIPLRNIFLSPKQLISRLELQKDSHVLEVGPGPGYFSTRIAKVIPAGKLVLADIQQEMLDKARKRISAKGFSNVDYYLCDGERFSLPDGSFDVIFMVTVIGEIENKVAYIREFCRMLKKGGLLSFSESRGDPDKMSIQELKDLVKDYGFTFDRVYGNENNFTINFLKDH